MEKYLVFILLSAPGFIAHFIAKLLGSFHSKKGEFDSIMVYFSYSLFSLSLTLGIACLFGLFKISEPWSVIEQKFLMPDFSFYFLIISILSSVLVGMVWQLKVKSFIECKFNEINRKLSGNVIFMEGSLFEKIFVDGEYHFLVIEKKDQELIAGFLTGWSSPKSERIEVQVSSSPVYQEWLDYAKKNPDHCLNNIKGTYIDISNGTVIKELEYPLEWTATLEV